jgi:hypothetical protein
MNATRTYRPRAAKKPFQFWLQPFLLLLVVILLWRLMPLSALLYASRVVPPLPDAHVFYVTLDPEYAAEALRASMQAWRRAAVGGENDITLVEIDSFMPLGAPAFLRRGRRYPGRWAPCQITPLAQALPDLLCTEAPAFEYGGVPPEENSRGVRTVLDPALERAGFRFPWKRLSALAGSGRCRAYVETGGEGSVVHVLILEGAGANAAVIERALALGDAGEAVAGEVLVMWRVQ